MGKSYKAGSVSAKITLDKSELDEALANLKKQTNDIKKQSAVTSQEVTDHIEKVGKVADQLKQKNKGLAGSFEDVGKSAKKEADTLKTISPELQNVTDNIDKVAESNDKLSKSNEKATKSMKKMQKQSKLMTTDLEKAFTKDLHKAIEEAEKIFGGKAVPLKPIFDELSQKYSKQAKDIENFSKMWIKALANIKAEFKLVNKEFDKVKLGTTKSGKQREFNVIGISQLKTIEEVEKGMKGIAETTEKTTESVKQLEKGLTETGTAIKVDTKLVKELYDYIYPMTDETLSLGLSSISLKHLEKEFADINSDAKQLKKELTEAMGVLNAPARKSKKGVFFDISNLKEPLLETAEATDKVTESTKKATEATKELETVMLDLSGNTKYSYNELMANYDQLPAKIKTALDGVSRVLATHGKDWSDSMSEYLKDVKAWAGQIPFLNIDQLISSKNDGAYHTLGQFWRENEKYLKEYEKYLKKPSKDWLFTTKYAQTSGMKKGERTKIGKDEFIAYDDSYDYVNLVNTKVIEKLKEQLKALQEVEIVSRKTGEVIKQLGTSEESTSKSTKKVTDDVKQLGESVKYTAEQVTILDDVFKKASFQKGKKLVGGGVSNTAPFKRLYQYLENEYMGVLTQYDPSKHKPSKFRKQFQARLAPLLEVLGIGLSPEKIPSGKVGEFYPAMNFAGRRVGSYDVSNLIGEKEFRSLIGEVEELKVAEEQTVTTTEKLTEETKQLGEASKYTANQLQVMEGIFYRLQHNGTRQGSERNQLPFSLLYHELENQYLETLTGSDFSRVINPDKLRRRFQRELKPLLDKLGVNLLETEYEGYKSIDFAGSRVGAYDVSNILSEDEFNRLIGETKQLSKADDELATKTEEVTSKIKEEQAWLMALSNAIKMQVQPPLNNFSKESDKIIDNLTRMARANELFSGSAQKTANALKQIDEMKKGGYAFGFKDYDLFDARYIRNTGRAMKEARILPKNKENRKYTGWDKHFLMKFFESLYKTPLGKADRIYPSDLKVPPKSHLNDRRGISYPYHQKYLRDYEDNYTQFVKDIQTHIIGLLKEFNIELSTELANAGTRIRVWIEELGKYQNIGSLDLSKMVKFESFEEFERFLDRATKNNKELSLLSQNADKAKESVIEMNQVITTSSESSIQVLRTLIENYKTLPASLRSVLQELNKVNQMPVHSFEDYLNVKSFLENFRKKYGLILQETHTVLDADRYIFDNLALVLKGITPLIWDYDTWLKITEGTTLSFEQATKKLGENLNEEVSVVERLGEQEEKTASSTEKLQKKIDKLIKSSIKFSKNLGRETIFYDKLNPKLERLLGIPKGYDPAMFHWGEHLAPYKKGNRMWQNEAKHFTHGLKGGIPILTWEQIKKLPITKPNVSMYGQSISGGRNNYSPLDVYNKMYSYEELMEHFWELPRVLQSNLAEIKKVIDERFQGKIPKNFEKAGIWQLAPTDIIEGKAVKFGSGRHNYKGNEEGWFSPMPIKGIPVRQHIAVDKTHRDARSGDYSIFYDDKVIFKSVKDVEEFYVAIGRLDKELISTKNDVEQVATEVKQLGGVEETTVKSTDNFVKSLQKANAQAQNLRKSMYGVFPNSLTEKRGMYGKIEGYEEVPYSLKDLVENYDKLSAEQKKSAQELNAQIQRLAHLDINAQDFKDHRMFLANKLREFSNLVNFDAGTGDQSPLRGIYGLTYGIDEIFKLIIELDKLVNGYEHVETAVNNTKPALEDFNQCVLDTEEPIDKLITAEENLTKVEKDLELQTEHMRPIISNLFGGVPNNAIENIILSIDEDLKKVENTALRVLGIRKQLVAPVPNTGKKVDIFGENGLFALGTNFKGYKSYGNLEWESKAHRKYVQSLKQPLGISGYIGTSTDSVKASIESLNLCAETIQNLRDLAHSLGMSFEELVLHNKEFVSNLDRTNREMNKTSERFTQTAQKAEYLAVMLRKVNEIPTSSKGAGVNVHDVERVRNLIREVSAEYQLIHSEGTIPSLIDVTPFEEVLDAFPEKAKEVESEIRKMKQGFEELAGIMGAQINPNGIKDYAEALKMLGRDAEKAQTDMKRLREQMGIVLEGKSPMTNIFKQVDKEMNGWFKHDQQARYDTTRLTDWIFDKEGNLMGGQPVAKAIDTIKTLNFEVLNLSSTIKNKFFNLGMENSPLFKDIELFEKRVIELSSRMYQLWKNPKGKYSAKQALGEDFSGEIGVTARVGYSDYVANIVEVTQKLAQQTDVTKQSLLKLAEALKVAGNELGVYNERQTYAVQMLTQMAQANEKFSKTKTLGQKVTDIDTILFGDAGLKGKGLGTQTGLTSTLEHFSGLSNKNADVLLKFKNEAKGLERTFVDLNELMAKGAISTETYEREIDKLTEKVQRLKAESQKGIRELNLVDPKKAEQANSSIKKSTDSLREFGTTMGKQEQYVNNLYRGLQKARSIIISIKTIGRMMGGMAVWNFAFELVESAKETYKAKNEMESLLAKNTKVNTSGVDAYNKALDETVNRFQKINKYSLGETGASIGLEFNLNAQEMGKSLPIIAMIQSEYVRAGRTVEEASLAVKDILQGEFMRLSRETGVGKDDLMEKYGWNGDNTDVLNLMKALEKAGKERHWDQFAEKATSLNDVLTITQSRFSELGAELGTTAEPMIVGAFNAILGAVDSLKQGFEGMDSFGKNATVLSGSVGGIYGIGTAYMVLAKNVGLADIATLGWHKSLASSVLHLNKADVALHGFNKTLLASLSGTKASTVAQSGLGKALVGRLMGVNQTTIAEQGLGHAMLENVFKLKEEKQAYIDVNNIQGKNINLEKASILNKSKSASITGKLGDLELSRSQKLAYMTTKLKYAEVANMNTSKALLKTATSAKVLGTAIKGIFAIGIITWFASMASWADKIKTNIQGFYNVVDNGKQIVKDSKKEWQDSKKAIEEQDKTIAKYNAKNKDTTALLHERNQLVANSHQAYKNLGIAQHANELAKVKADRLEKKRTGISLAHQNQLAKAYEELGNTNNKATLMANDYYNEVLRGSDYAEQALDKYNTRLKNSVEHSKAFAQSLKDQGLSQDRVNQYMMDYNLVAEETAENWKKFDEGDLWSGAYALMGEVKQMWTDFTYTTEAQTLFQALGKFIDWLYPKLIDVANALKEVGKWAINAFSWLVSSDLGSWIVTLTGVGTVIGVVAVKLGKWVTGSKSTIDILKTMKSKLTDVWKGWKRTGEEAEKAGKKIPKRSDEEMGTGGITPEGKVPSKVSLKEGLINDLKTNVRNYANYATQLAFFMGLVTEAIYLIQAPMWALAEVGKTFKAKEQSIQAGIEGLKLIAPTVIAVMLPVMALVKVMDMWGDKFTPSLILKSIGGIVVGLGLVTLSIGMLIPPIYALGALGGTYQGMQEQVVKGTEAMKIVASSLMYLLPFVPAMVLGIALVDAMFTNLPLGIMALGIVAGGIAVGMLLVTEAIWTLQAPLWAIGELGSKFQNLDNVQQGAEALKLTAEALTYVGSAMTSLTLIDINLLGQNIAQVVSDWFGVDLGGSLTDLTAEGGVLDQLNTFITQFANYNITVPEGFEDKINSIKTAGEGVKSIGDAMLIAKQAMDNLPEEFKKGGINATYDMKTDTTTIKSQDTVTDYFETFKEPIRQLKQFIDEFTTSDEFKIELGDDWETRVGNITKSADMITQINTAVEQVKSVMQNIGSSGHETAFAEGGAIMALGYDLFHMTGEDSINNGQSSGSYKSSLGSSLQAMEDIVSDMFTFQSRISQYGTGEGGDGANVGGVANIVTQVQQAISSLSQSLSDAVPQMEGHGKSIGSAIVNGVKSGLDGLGGDLITKVASAIDSAKPTAETYGKGLGWKVQNGFKSELKVETALSTELTNTLNNVNDGKIQEFYDKGKALGDAFARGFKDGSGIRSPGYSAQALESEIGYMEQYLNNGIINLPSLASQLGTALSSNFNVDFNLSNFSFPDISQWASNLGTVLPTLDGFKSQVSTKFDGMKLNVQNSFNSILSKTRTTMANMKSATVGHIGNITSSWSGMQSALIASAEHIKSQTTQKIDKIKSNLSDFWNKIKHPDQLIAGGKPTGSIRRRNMPNRTPSIAPMFAGSPMFKQKISRKDPSDYEKEGWLCQLLTGSPCYSGGWSFNGWNPQISRKFKGWGTHFNKFNLDNHLKVGSFENSNFPVRGKVDIFRDYIKEVIGATQYDYYYNSRYSPAEALRRGAFNCWDGTQIILAIARAFGITGGGMGHGSWGKDGHVWATIPGIGVIDPTAIQRGYGFRSPKVKGYGAGSPSKSAGNPPKGDTNNHNEIHIHIEGDVYGVDDLNDKIEEGAKRVARQLFRNKYSGV